MSNDRMWKYLKGDAKVIYDEDGSEPNSITEIPLLTKANQYIKGYDANLQNRLTMIEFKAGNFIELNPGFEAHAGADGTGFDARIDEPITSKVGKSLYNGNIAWMMTDLTHFGKRNGLQTMAYRYDQLNRIKRADAFNYADRTWQKSGNNYGVRYNYDPNGNLMELQRFNGTGLLMDKLTYHYDYKANGTYAEQKNRLKHVYDWADKEDADYNSNTDLNTTTWDWDQLSNAPVAGDGTLNNKDFTSQGAENYKYDAIGNLIEDEAEGIESIEWTVYGKVRKVNKANGNYTSYMYDPAGNRVKKTVFVDGNTRNTYYSRDASGNVMAVYESKKLKEQPIYGSSRLGMYRVDEDGGTKPMHRTMGNKLYELSNHLGNVLTVITDNKYGIDEDADTQADYYAAHIISADDYYPFGLSMGSGATEEYATERTYINEMCDELLLAYFEDDLDGFEIATPVANEIVERTAEGRIRMQTGVDVNAPKLATHTPASTWIEMDNLEIGKTYDISFELTGDCETCSLGNGEVTVEVSGASNAELTKDFKRVGENTLSYTATSTMANFKFILDGTPNVNNQPYVAQLDNVKIVHISTEEVTVQLDPPTEADKVGRSYQSETYRYGFNGKENDTDFGNKHLIQDYGFRLYNPSIGKFTSVDPLAPDYPWYTPYQFAGNKPISSIDLDGLEDWDINGNYIDPSNKSIIQGPVRDAKKAITEDAQKREKQRNTGKIKVNNNTDKLMSGIVSSTDAVNSVAGVISINRYLRAYQVATVMDESSRLVTINTEPLSGFVDGDLNTAFRNHFINTGEDISTPAAEATKNTKNILNKYVAPGISAFAVGYDLGVTFKKSNELSEQMSNGSILGNATGNFSTYNKIKAEKQTTIAGATTRTATTVAGFANPGGALVGVTFLGSSLISIDENDDPNSRFTHTMGFTTPFHEQSEKSQSIYTILSNMLQRERERSLNLQNTNPLEFKDLFSDEY